MRRIRVIRAALALGVALDGVSFGQEPESLPLASDEALAAFSVDPGYAVELVASEPLTVDPVAIDWGFDGKLWVAEMADYPYGMDGEGKPGGRVRYLEDTDGDGRMDRSTLFIEGLSFPTSVMAYYRGVLIAAAPDLLYAEDKNGDGKADVRMVLATGFMEGNQQLRMNSLRWGLDGLVYGAAGGHHAGFGAQNRVRIGLKTEVALGSGDFRFVPDSMHLERLAGPSQFGRVRDDWGHWFGVQNSFPLWHYVLEEVALNRNPHVPLPDVRQQLRGAQPRVFGAKPSQKRFHGFDHVGRYTSACGPCIYRDDWLFPDSVGVTHAFTCEPFSNLVQHHHLTRTGVTFEGKRAPTVSETDFLASSDRWCRPVMTRTGPDGALWVVDMYRYMIEHPDWLPQEGRDELKPHYRHGDDRGRIYRVVRKDAPRKEVPKLVGEPVQVLVDHLTNPNGVVRDAAQRLMSVKQEPGVYYMPGIGSDPNVDILPALHELVKGHPSAKVRAQAFWTLTTIGWPDPKMPAWMVQDPHPEVRRLALESPYVTRDLVRQLASDLDPRVRLDAAIALGDSEAEEDGKVLLALARRDDLDRYTKAAVISSIPNHFGVFARAAGELRHHESILQALLSMAPNYGGDAEVLLDQAIASQVPQALDFRLLAHWLDIVREGEPLKDWSGLMGQARRRAGDAEADEALRVSALGLVGRRAVAWDGDRVILQDCLSPKTPLDVQKAALLALRRSGQEEAPRLLLGRWNQLSPSFRSLAVDSLIDEKAWRVVLIGQLRRESLTGNDFNASQRQRLTKIEPSAREWLEAAPGREEAMKKHAGALQLDGEARFGRAIFMERCALCHEVDGEGKAIGPDLRAVTNRDPAALYASIIDPNRAVEPLYQAYTATSRDGTIHYGVLKQELGHSVTLQTLDGMEHQLLRRDLESLETNQASLMPEGLEVGLSDEALADLIAFVQAIR